MAALTIDPAVGMSADGRLELFVTGTYGNLYHISRTAPSNAWTTWSAFGAPAGVKLASSPAVKASNDGRLELFAVGDDGALYHTWQVAANNGWSPWFSHGTPSGFQALPRSEFTSPLPGELNFRHRQPISGWWSS